MRPLAIICAFNESDILPGVMRHLESQGVDVYILDNWSTDLDSLNLANWLYPNGRYERWPAERPTFYDWTGILKRVEEIALEHGRGRWVMLHDADEIRSAPSDGNCCLAGAFENAQSDRFNAVQFAVRTYVPIDNSWEPGGDPEEHFRYYREDHVDNGIPHIKAWLQGDERVDLHTHGGHQVLFPGRKVEPTPFVLKHYPIRSQEHGERKVLKERFPRYSPVERAKQWHVQYDEYRDAPNFLGDPRILNEEPRECAIVTLTRFPDIFAAFAESVERHEPGARKIVVTSGGCEIMRPGWEVIPGVEPFVFARNMNLGIAAAGDADVLAVNDDVVFMRPIISDLSHAAYETNAAIVSPQIMGDGINNHKAQSSHPLQKPWESSKEYIPFVCVYLRRTALNAVGPLDESFRGYGGEDVEFGLRCQKYGWPMIVSDCYVRHGHGEHTHSSSFLRVMSNDQRNAEARASANRAKVFANEPAAADSAETRRG